MKTYRKISEVELNEGLYDKNIFKAFFLAGGPGSGKTFVTHGAFTGHGLRVINSDSAFENALKKNNLSLKMPDSETETRNMLRARAKATIGKVLDLSIAGRLGMVVDGTGRDYGKISSQVRMLKELGYDCYMVFVNTSLNVALERNKQRERTVPAYATTKSWEQVQSNMGKFQNLFGLSNFIVVDNNANERELATITINKMNKVIRGLLSRSISSYTAKRWMATERKIRRRT
jgi:predicted kinase